MNTLSEMSLVELKAFEHWLMTSYEKDMSVPFAVLAKVLKMARASVKSQDNGRT